MTPPTAKALAGYQRRHLRKLAHGKSPIVTVGEAGISDKVISALDQALADHELVKVKLPGAEGKKQLGAELAKRSSAHLCGLVGHMAILFRPDPEAPQIELPTRGEQNR